MPLAELLATVRALPQADQLKVMGQIVRDFLASHPDQEIAVMDDQREAVAFCVPNALYRHVIPPDLLAEMKERAANPGPLMTWPQLRAKLEKLAGDEEKVA